jgi:RHS repeat-associated protein
MLTNGVWSYTWNGENRMISAQTTARRVEFAYDYMGRCFERKEYTAANGSWNLDKTIYIVYDEYKQIAEYVNGELYQQYAWDVAGLDTVAFMGKNNSTYMYWTDGNKNVLKLFDATGVQASYSYDPFGKVTTAEGLLAVDNPFRFSSEYHNNITSLVEYIYRKYDPVMGRWINRDPIEEQGGLNIYGSTNNSPLSIYDNLGLWVLKSNSDKNAARRIYIAENMNEM